MAPNDRRPESDAPPWLEITRRRVARWCAGGAGKRWLVAVSGGSDSVGLLLALHRLAPDLGLSLIVAHLDHGYRGEASRADAVFVQDLASRLGLDCELGHWRPTRTAHFEADARRARYTWLLDVAVQREARAVAVGHTRDDLAETILHRIIRGTGLRGLSGIPACRSLGGNPTAWLVRPLLSASGRDVREALAAWSQPFREDSTNADLTRTRARIRHDLLPKLAAEYNPRVAEALARLGAIAASAQGELDRRLAESEEDVIRALGPHLILLDQAAFLQLPMAQGRELLRSAWQRAGWPEAAMSSRRWNQLAQLARSRDAGPRDIAAGVILTEADGHIRLARPNRISRQAQPALEPTPIEVPGCARWARDELEVVLDDAAARDETLDRDRLIEPLFIRAPAPGDRFDPLGMAGRTTPLKDFLRARRVPRDERGQTPLVCDQVGILWVTGHRIADRVKLTNETRRTIGLRWRRLEHANDDSPKLDPP